MQKNRGLLAGMRQQLRVLGVRLTCPDLTRETVDQRKENLSRPYKVNICNHAEDASKLFFLNWPTAIGFKLSRHHFEPERLSHEVYSPQILGSHLEHCTSSGIHSSVKVSVHELYAVIASG